MQGLSKTTKRREKCKKTSIVAKEMAVFCARMRYIFELCPKMPQTRHRSFNQKVKVADLLIERDIIFDQKADRSYIYAKPWRPRTWISLTLISNHRRDQVYFYTRVSLIYRNTDFCSFPLLVTTLKKGDLKTPQNLPLLRGG